MALARFIGSPDLKIPEPTKIPSAPKRIIRAASAGVAMPPAEKLTTGRDRKSTRLNSSHLVISYAVFCLKKKELISPKFEHARGSLSVIRYGESGYVDIWRQDEI